MNLAMIDHRDSLIVRKTNIDVDKIRFREIVLPRQLQVDSLAAADRFKRFRGFRS